MADSLSIRQADSINSREINVTLSDGRVLVLTLDQLLNAEPRVLLPDIEEE